MLKKTVAYTDYNGVEKKKTLYFDLSKTELTEMSMLENGSLQDKIQSIIDAKDNREIYLIYKDLILKGYGEKSLDGEYFNKSAELSEAFSHTRAYDVLFMELLSDEEAAVNFVKGMLPDDLQAEIANKEKLNS